MPIVRLKDGRQFEAPQGARLTLVLRDHNIDILHRCGGYARCTTCRVSFLEGEPHKMTQAEYDKLSERGLLGSVRLSCQILCEADMTVEPLMSLVSQGLDDPGERPTDNLTPEPVWRDRP
ncbi:MAG: (2Fe-2S)-binding protein [Anaerolineae bacterium]|nr:(2Fe-2S)-binding protein [Anaerolineae bacterium]MDW8172784.1 2Fe-2S iron-sulfur cluster-binding protein [Anaerolineae bacterium]